MAGIQEQATSSINGLCWDLEKISFLFDLLVYVFALNREGFNASLLKKKKDSEEWGKHVIQEKGE